MKSIRARIAWVLVAGGFFATLSSDAFADQPIDPVQARIELTQPTPQEAKAISAKLSAAQKSKAQASFKQAFELFQAGQFDAAILGFEQGLAIDPGDGRANYYLGECLDRQDQDALAKLRYQRAVYLAPGTKEALLAQAWLAKH
jgi:Flp pilus assembly protein TadD